MEEGLAPNLKILSLNFIDTASKGLYKNNSDGPLFKALTSVLLIELRPLAGCHKILSISHLQSNVQILTN